MIEVEIENDGRIIRLPDGLSMAEISAAIDALPPPEPIHGWARSAIVEPYQPDEDVVVTARYTATLTPTAPKEPRYANGIRYGLAEDLEKTLTDTAPSTGAIHPHVLRRSAEIKT